MLFLCLCDLGRKTRHKATTHNGAPQGIVNYFKNGLLIYTNCDIMKIQKCHQRELGSSLPIMGGGGCYD